MSEETRREPDPLRPLVATIGDRLALSFLLLGPPTPTRIVAGWLVARSRFRTGAPGVMAVPSQQPKRVNSAYQDG